MPVPRGSARRYRYVGPPNDPPPDVERTHVNVLVVPPHSHLHTPRTERSCGGGAYLPMNRPFETARTPESHFRVGKGAINLGITSTAHPRPLVGHTPDLPLSEPGSIHTTADIDPRPD